MLVHILLITNTNTDVLNLVVVISSTCEGPVECSPNAIDGNMTSARPQPPPENNDDEEEQQCFATAKRQKLS
jgi:hypothetical protein